MPPRDDAAALAAALRSTIAEHAAELARVAEGGAVTVDTLDAGAAICRAASVLLLAAPLPPWWSGYLGAYADAVDGLADAVGYADIAAAGGANTGGNGRAAGGPSRP